MSYSPFGATADHFLLIASGAVGEDILEIVGAGDGKDQGGEGLSHDADGTIVAHTAFDTAKANPSNSFLVNDDLDLSGISLGQCSGAATPFNRITSVVAKTANGAELPTLDVSGDAVPVNTGRTFALPAFTLLAKYSAQLFGACTITNGHATGSTFTASLEAAPISTNGVGTPINNDCSGGFVEVQIELNSYTTTAPTVTPAEGWRIVKPLALTEPKTGYHTGSVTLRKDLTVDVA